MPKKPRKSPEDKKALSLERDRRNTYGENAKSSRRNLPKAKARPHRANRRAAHQALSAAEGEATVDAADVAELQLHHKRPKSFRKQPDTPLGEVLARKASRRAGTRASVAGPATRKSR